MKRIGSLALLAAACLLAGPAAVLAGGGNSITSSPSAPTTATGVAFTVTTGGGNRDYATVNVGCTDGTVIVYATTLNVLVSPKGSGTSQTIYPPASSCTADLVKSMSIGKDRVLASTSFTVTQAP